MPRRALPFLVAALLLHAGPAAAATPEELARRIAAAREIAADVAQPSPEAMDRVRAALSLPETVVVDGRDVTVPADPFLARLSGETADDFRLAESHLHALEDAMR